MEINLFYENDASVRLLALWFVNSIRSQEKGMAQINYNVTPIIKTNFVGIENEQKKKKETNFLYPLSSGSFCNIIHKLNRLAVTLSFCFLSSKVSNLQLYIDPRSGFR